MCTVSIRQGWPLPGFPLPAVPVLFCPLFGLSFRLVLWLPGTWLCWYWTLSGITKAIMYHKQLWLLFPWCFRLKTPYGKQYAFVQKKKKKKMCNQVIWSLDSLVRCVTFKLSLTTTHNKKYVLQHYSIPYTYNITKRWFIQWCLPSLCVIPSFFFFFNLFYSPNCL